jgi:hypothetical protein
MTETRPSWLLPPVDSLTEFPTQQIARQLSRICRYAGSTPRFYSVGRHSLLVAELVPHDPALRLAALVHDAHECWTGDLCRPAKQVTGSALDRLTRQYDDKLHALLGLDLSIADREIVRMADDAACKLEMAWLDKTVDEILTARPNRGLQNVHLAFGWSFGADENDWRRAVEGVLSEVGRVR